jgi:hypothetical protein
VTRDVEAVAAEVLAEHSRFDNDRLTDADLEALAWTYANGHYQDLPQAARERMEKALPVIKQIVAAARADERERIGSQCRGWAVQRFDQHGPYDARGAALWDVASHLAETQDGGR